MQPTILSGVQPGNPAFRDEFFGPVAMSFCVEDKEAAVALTNDSDFGSGGSVFTRNIARGKRVASRVDVWMMFVNNISGSDAELPFGSTVMRWPLVDRRWLHGGRKTPNPLASDIVTFSPPVPGNCSPG